MPSARRLAWCGRNPKGKQREAHLRRRPDVRLPDSNYPAFHAAASQLRARGFEVENPAENPAPRCGTWQAYMRLAVRQLALCDGVVLLPNWHNSRGARAEFRLATDLMLPVEPIEVVLSTWKPAQ